MVGGPEQGEIFDEYGNLIVREQSRTVADWEFVSVFLSLVEYVVLHDKNNDDSVPSARAQSLWTLLFDQGVIAVPFCPRKWKIVRDRLERLGVLKIDHLYYRGQAMKWWANTWFPGLGLWKAKKAKRLGEALPVMEFLIGQREGREIHNSLVQHISKESEAPSLFWGSGRDPPTNKHPIRQFQGGNEAGLN